MDKACLNTIIGLLLSSGNLVEFGFISLSKKCCNEILKHYHATGYTRGQIYMNTEH